jgi:hypothetical protein
MSRGRARFTQADLNRAIRAAKQAGACAVIMLPDGTIRIELTAETEREREQSNYDGSDIIL